MPCFNSFCVLRFNDSGVERVLVGTALNFEISNSSDSLPYIFLVNVTNKSIDYCNDALSTTGWNKCKNKDVWYNSNIESVIFSNYNFTIENQWYYETPYNGMIRNLENTFKRQDDYLKIPLSEIILMNKFFKLKNYEKEITAFRNKFGKSSFVIINYSGLQTDICEDIKIIKENNDSCKKLGSEYLVFDYKIKNIKDFSLENYWKELTAKIRFKKQ